MPVRQKEWLDGASKNAKGEALVLGVAVQTDGANRQSTVVESIWQNCVERLEAELTSHEIHAWIRPLQARDRDGSMELLAPSRYVRQQIEIAYLDRIGELVLEEDKDGRIEGVVLSEGSRRREHRQPLAASRHNPPDADGSGANWRTARLNPDFVFERFVEGKCNDFAKSAAWQVAANPNKNSNPLLLFGGVGLGKTHLMQAVGHQVLHMDPGATVIYSTAEEFTTEMVGSIRTGRINSLMSRLASADVLLIDDVQFFADRSIKVKAQEEFFHLFNRSTANEHRVVLTSDRYPSEIDGLEARLQSRFVGGLTVEVVRPELETRVAILQRLGETDGVYLPDDVAFQIAERVRSSVRELKGALTRVVAHVRYQNAPAVTAELAQTALRDIFAVQTRRITVDRIQRVVAEYYHIKLAEMMSRRRERNVARPRQLAMALAKELTGYSLPEIGDRFGGKDHTTVLYACRKIAELRTTNPDVAEDYRNLSRILAS